MLKKTLFSHCLAALCTLSAAVAQPAPLAEPFLVTETDAGDPQSSALAVAPDGRFAVVWKIGWGGGTFLRTFDAEGRPLSGALRIGPESNVLQVAASATGEVLVVTDGAYPLLEVRRFSFDGAALGTPGAIDLGAGFYDPRFCFGETGTFGVVWWLDGGLWFQRFDLAGSPLGERRQIVAPTTHPALEALGCAAEGRFAVAWSQPWQGDPRYPVFKTRFFAADGSPVGAIAELGGWPDDSLIGAVAIGVSTDGTYLVGTIRDPATPLLRLFDRDGRALSPALTLPTEPPFHTLGVIGHGGDRFRVIGYQGAEPGLETPELLRIQSSALDAARQEPGPLRTLTSVWTWIVHAGFGASEAGGLVMLWQGLLDDDERGLVAQVFGALDPGTLVFHRARAVGEEGAGSVELIVERRGGSAGRVGAELRTGGGSAAPGVDYEVVATPVVFEDGDSQPKSVRIGVWDDLSPEAHETFGVRLADPWGGAVLGGVAMAEVEIRDDDATPGLVPVGAPISPTIAFSAGCPEVALARTGELLLGWLAGGVETQRFSSGGMPLEEIESHAGPGSYPQESLALAAAPDGTLHLAWTGWKVVIEGRDLLSYFDTWVQHAGSATDVWGEPRRAVDAYGGSPLSGHVPRVGLVAAPDGSLVAFGELAAFYRLLALHFGPAASDFSFRGITEVTANNIFAPEFEAAIGAGADNQLVAVWELPYDGFGTGTAAAPLLPSQEPGTVEVVSNDASDVEAQPQIAGLHDGGFLAVWRELDAQTASWRLMARRLGADGMPVGEEFQIDARPEESPDRPRLAALGDGTALVVWEGHRAGDAAVALRARVLGADGRARGPELELASAGGAQACPTVAANASGGAVVAWREVDAGGDGTVVAQRFAPAVCADTTQLCLRGGRYVADLRWRNPHDASEGEGHAVPLTADAGGFALTQPGELELAVKLVDGGAVNGHDWVFFGALTDAEFLLRVTDTATGLMRRYHNPPFRRASSGDTEAFAASSMLDAEPIACPKQRAEPVTLLGRFEVEIGWKDFLGRRGAGQGVALSDDTLYAWFFTPDNLELVLRMQDGRPQNGQFWVFLGSLSNVEYRVVISDVFTGRVHGYVNLLGNFASGADLRAFPG